MGNSCFLSPCVQVKNTSTPLMWFLFTLAIAACVETKQHENCCSRRINPRDHWSRAVFRVWSLSNIIKEDKNVTQGLKPTALLNLCFLYRWFYICVIQLTDLACFIQYLSLRSYFALFLISLNFPVYSGLWLFVGRFEINRISTKLSRHFW